DQAGASQSVSQRVGPRKTATADRIGCLSGSGPRRCRSPVPPVAAGSQCRRTLRPPLLNRPFMLMKYPPESLMSLAAFVNETVSIWRQRTAAGAEAGEGALPIDQMPPDTRRLLRN